MDSSWFSILPPLVAIVLAIWTRQVYISLFLGIWIGWTVLAGGNPIQGLRESLDACIRVFQDEGNTKVIAFSAMVGALIAFTQRSGGVQGFIQWIQDRNLIQTRRGAQLLSWLIGVGIFVESSVTCLVNGSVCRPLFDRFRISREKLAYLCDATSAPICILIPLNAWGAYVSGLLSNEGASQPVQLMLQAIPFNFYALITLIVSFTLVMTGWDFGPMARAEKRAQDRGEVLRHGAEPLVAKEIVGMEPKPGLIPRAHNFLVPLVVLVLMMPIGLFITGKGNLTHGSGSTSVFWAVLAATGIAAIMYRFSGIMKTKELTDLFFKGFGGLIPLALLMVLAFAMGDLARQLQTGPFVASLATGLVHPSVVPALLFIIAGFIAFSTGTSFGTFAIMIPIAIPMAHQMGIQNPIVVAAVLGGGVFGDHCSPISDTTIISSMASASDHIDHVNTQLPYALSVAGISAILFLVTGLVTT